MLAAISSGHGHVGNAPGNDEHRPRMLALADDSPAASVRAPLQSAEQIRDFVRWQSVENPRLVAAIGRVHARTSMRRWEVYSAAVARGSTGAGSRILKRSRSRARIPKPHRSAPSVSRPWKPRTG